MTRPNNQVTAVIPTSGNRQALVDAVASALAQRDVGVEVRIVGDGVSTSCIARILGTLASDARVAIETLPPTRSGSNAARNFGVETATSEWVAFLDDDDRWHTDKLARQLAVAPRDEPRVILSHRFVARTGERDYIWPRLIPSDRRHLSEYLFCRSGLFAGDGHLQTSTLLTRRSFALAHPFREDLRRHQDHDWVLRCVYEGGGRVVMSPDVLSEYVVPNPGAASISARGCWHERWEWASSNRHLFTARGYAGFLTSYCVFAATLDGDRRAVGFLVREACRNGKPRLRDLFVAAALTIVPPETRRRVRARFAGAPVH